MFWYARVGWASTAPLLKAAQGPPQLHYWRLPRGLHSFTTEGCPGASTAPLLKAAQGSPQLHYWRLPRGLHSSTTEGCPGASTAPLLKAAQGPPQLHYWRLPRGLHSSTTEGCPGASTAPLLKAAQGPSQLHYWSRGLHNQGASITRGLHMSQSGPGYGHFKKLNYLLSHWSKRHVRACAFRTQLYTVQPNLSWK